VSVVEVVVHWNQHQDVVAELVLAVVVVVVVVEVFPEPVLVLRVIEKCVTL